MTEKLVCPRRAENPGNWRYPDSDEWRADNTCSYCGSLNPEILLRAMAEDHRCELGPTDKNYKIYVSIGDRDNNKCYFQHFSVEQQIRFIELMNTKPPTFTIGYPGHFYVLPFFIMKSKGGE